MSIFREQRQFIGQVASSRSAVRKRAQWEERGQRYMRGHGGVRPGQLVSVDPALQQKVLGLMAQVAPTLAAAFERHLVPVAERAWDAWPVLTGLSKSLLTLEFQVEGGGSRFRGSIRNRAPYAVFIGHDRYTKGAVVRDLVWGPGEAAAKEIARDADKDLARVLNR